MQLLVITELFMPTKGGTAIWFDEAYRRLGGKEIHIVTAEVPGAAAYDKTHRNTVHRVRIRRHWWMKPESLGMYAKLLWRSLTIAFTNKIEAVHTGRVLPEGLVGWVVARLIRVPLVIYAHGEEITTWRQSGKFRAMCFVYRHADCVIANSDFTQAELIKLGVSKTRIRLISPGVDVQRFHPEMPCEDLKAKIGLQAGQKLILSVGRLQRRKGFDNVIRSLPELAKNGLDVRYALIGVGEDREYLERLAQELGVADRVDFLGHVNPEDLPRWFNACDVFAMPNREINGDTEGFGIVFMEAAACGKPAIAGMAGGTGAAILDDITGLRVDGERVEAIVAGLHAVLSDAAHAARLSQAALNRARADFSWDAVAQKTIALMKEMQHGA